MPQPLRVPRSADRRVYFTEAGAPKPPPLLERRRGPDRRERGFISRLRLFAGIPYELVEAFVSGCPRRSLAAGEVLLEAGRPNDQVFLLLAGRLYVRIGEEEGGDRIAVEAGECIGELSIIDGRPVSARVCAEVASEVLCVSEDKVWETLMPVPGLARNLLRALAARMRHSNQLMLARLHERLQLEHLQKELQIANRIQHSMLPSHFPLFPERHELDLYAVMEPATVVGGDFYDAFLITPDKLFVAIGDVAGKGVPAALFMARSMTQLRMEARTGRPPAEVLRRANAQLCENNEEAVFVTLLCGVLDLGSGEFVYAVGGHAPPLHGDAEAGFSVVPVARSVMVGVLPGREYAQGRLHLAPGQCLVLYTDGVTEASDPDQALYGEERFLGVLDRCRAAPPDAMVGAVLDDIRAFARDCPQADDITLLVVRYLGP